MEKLYDVLVVGELNVDLILDEIEKFPEVFLTGKDNLKEAIDSIKEYTNILVIKRGNKGSKVHFNDQLLDLPPFLNKQVVDAIGAGDSFNAGFIYKFINGNSIPECQKFGNLTGAVSTTAAGGTNAFKVYENFRDTAKEKFGIVV
ncbi:MAG: carbohydrate kinase family protein [Bacteroidales bacterium]